MNENLQVSQLVKNYIEKTCMSEEFDQYMKDHVDNLVEYFRPDNTIRHTDFRASSFAGCAQAICFRTVKEPVSNPSMGGKGKWRRAAHNGTFFHARMHMYFDYMHDKGWIMTIAKEKLKEDLTLNVSGTVDRVIEISVDGVMKRYVIDYKSIKADRFMELNAPKMDHKVQQHIYDLLNWEAAGWMMIYENKDEHDFKIYTEQYDNDMLQNCIKKLQQMDRWNEAYLKKVEPLPKISLIKDWCNYCEWKNKCKAVNKW